MCWTVLSLSVCMFSLALSLLRDVEGLLPFWAKGEELKDEAAAAVAFFDTATEFIICRKENDHRSRKLW